MTPPPSNRATVEALAQKWGGLLPTLALVGVAAVWGATFVIVADAVANYPLYAFLGIRFVIASVAFLAFFPKVFRRVSTRELRLGIPAGIFLAAGYITQTMGLLPVQQGGTTAARAAFLTGMYVVIVPILSSIFRRITPNWGNIAGVVLALAGTWFMSGIANAGSGTWVVGDTWVLASAFAFSGHMLVLGRANETHDTLGLTILQLIIVALITSVASVITGEGASLPSGPAAGQLWFALLLTGVLASAVAFVVQTWAQQVLVPSRVALILISEPAFGGVIGWLVAGSAPVPEVVGASLMMTGMVVSEIVSAKQAERRGEPLDLAMEGAPVYVQDKDLYRDEVIEEMEEDLGEA